MATFLKYHNGLLIPLREQETADFFKGLTMNMKSSQHTQSPNGIRGSQTEKLKNLLLVSAFIINTLLTLALLMGS